MVCSLKRSRNEKFIKKSSNDTLRKTKSPELVRQVRTGLTKTGVKVKDQEYKEGWRLKYI